MTPAEVYTVMQGSGEGVGQGYTSWPNSPDADVRYTHLSCEALEASGGCVRATEGVKYEAGATAAEGQPYVIWLPVAGATPPEPPPRPPEIDNTLPAEEPPPADAPPA